MSILEKTPGLLDALKGEMTPKFLATRSSDGIPNVVPVVSILPADDQPDTLFFGNFLLRKSIVNLEQNTHVGILVITADLKGWILTGEFIEWQRTGRYVERQMSGSLLRYNAYTGVRNAGIIRVKAVLGSFHISKLQVASDFLTTRIKGLQKQTHTADSRPVPLSVRTEFERMAAVKVMAWIDADGYPRVIPILSLQPVWAADARWRQPSGSQYSDFRRCILPGQGHLGNRRHLWENPGGRSLRWRTTQTRRASLLNPGHHRSTTDWDPRTGDEASQV
jgi:hypothetical protein